LSLTHYINAVPKKGAAEFFGVDHIRPPTLPNHSEVVNPYPGSLRERRLQTVVGTFTDYMIRKMFRDGLVAPRAEVISEAYLICEYAISLAQKVSCGAGADDTVEKIAAEGPKWLDAYLSRPIGSCIREVFMISQLDSVSRLGRFFQLVNLSDDEIRGLRSFVGRVQEWLRTEFEESNRVLLNPIYGHPSVCAADADLVVDDTLYEVKTTMYPQRSVRSGMIQLLGYVSLAYYHEKHPMAVSPPPVNLKKVGFLFPLSLVRVESSISDFTDDQKLFFLRRIIELRNREGEMSARARETSEPKDQDLIDIVRNLVRMGKL